MTTSLSFHMHVLYLEYIDIVIYIHIPTTFFTFTFTSLANIIIAGRFDSFGLYKNLQYFDLYCTTKTSTNFKN